MELDGITIPVHPWRYLYKAGSTIPKNTIRAVDKAEQQFKAIRPQFGACIHKSDWHGAIIYRQPKAGTYSDTNSFPAEEVIGFAVQNGRRTSIQQSVVQLDPPTEREGVKHQHKIVSTNTPKGIEVEHYYLVQGEVYTITDFEKFLAEIRAGTRLKPGTPYDAFDL